MDGTNPWFMLGLTAALVAAVVVIFTFHEKSDAEVYEEDVERVSLHIGFHLSLRWSLIEEVMLRFEKDSVVNEFFEKYLTENTEHKRMVFFMFCLRAMPYFGEVEKGYLTKEFAEKNLQLTKSLPKELQGFYETEMSIRDFRPVESLIEGESGEVFKLTMSEEGIKHWQERFVYWLPVEIPSDESERQQELSLLLHGSRTGNGIVLRFRKKPPKDSTPRKSDFRLWASRPAFGMAGA
ncbi:MAG: hypothetical protein QG653_452 [Patescibacteria group bacterium]|nr:hypothetical protein [Patescibacteria group bacterium]